MEYKDYYKILEVPRTATPAEIKRAYRKLARQHHPDVKPGDSTAERRFKDINEANAVLSDPEKRRRYDTLGPDWEHVAGASAPTPSSPFGSGVRYEVHGDGDFSDFFRAFFGETSPFGDSFGTAGPARARPAPGPLEATAELSLEEAYTGAERLAEVGGKRLAVKIPPGVDTGSRVRLAGGAGGGRDLMVSVSVRPHGVFTRRGADLEREIPITLGEALLGGKVTVRTLKGQVALTIPAGTQNGQSFRLTGQGMPRLGATGHGDLRVRVRVVLPGKLDEKARAAAKRLVSLIDQPDPRG